MAISTAISVASYSAVLAETFAAIGLSSIVPAGVVTVARLAKNAAGKAAGPETQARDEARDSLEALTGPADSVNDLLVAVADSLTSLDLLFPKTAKLHAEFTYEGREEYKLGVQEAAAVSLSGLVSVAVKAGFSALYEAKSTNRITLDVEFVSVNVVL